MYELINPLTRTTGGQCEVIEYIYGPVETQVETQAKPALTKPGTKAFVMRGLSEPIGWISYQIAQLYGWFAMRGWDYDA